MGIIGTKIYLSITQTVFSDFYPRLSARICEGPVNRAELGCVFCNSVARMKKFLPPIHSPLISTCDACSGPHSARSPSTHHAHLCTTCSGRLSAIHSHRPASAG